MLKCWQPELRGATVNLRGRFGSTVLAPTMSMAAALGGHDGDHGAAEELEVEDLPLPLIAMEPRSRERHEKNHHREFKATRRGDAVIPDRISRNLPDRRGYRREREVTVTRGVSPS
jgi:hypothetical protein